MIKALGDCDIDVRRLVAEALGKFGDPDELWEKILLSSSLSADAKFETLVSLQNVNYKKSSGTLRPFRFTMMRDPAVNALHYCKQQLQHPEEQMRLAAQEILESRSLLRRSAPSHGAYAEGLLRPIFASPSTMNESELLRASESRKLDVEFPPLRKQEGFLG